jgi:hypothetical protein
MEMSQGVVRRAGDIGGSVGSRGAALPECLAVGAIALVVAALAMVMGEGSRRLGRIGHDTANLRTIYAGMQSYAKDNAGSYPTLTWQPNVTYNTPWPELNTAGSNTEATMHQMVYLARTLTGRPAGELVITPNVLANLNFGHLVLCDYLGLSIPNRLFVSAGDRNKLLWADDPHGYDQGLYTPNLGVGDVNWRHPYAASFAQDTYLFDRSPLNSLMWGQSTSNYVVPATTVFGAASEASVTYPSQKVLLHDRFARYYGPRLPYCAMPEARLPLLMGDGAVTVRSATESNLGWNPSTPQGLASLTLTYSPNAIEPPIGGANTAVVQGRYMWTRAGIGGRDFGGPEVFP